jgi:hypothetical protein
LPHQTGGGAPPLSAVVRRSGGGRGGAQSAGTMASKGVPGVGRCLRRSQRRLLLQQAQRRCGRLLSRKLGCCGARWWRQPGRAPPRQKRAAAACPTQKRAS